jgi:hypothetical protein
MPDTQQTNYQVAEAKTTANQCLFQNDKYESIIRIGCCIIRSLPH